MKRITYSILSLATIAVIAWSCSKSFLDKKPQGIDYLFDSTLNRSSFSIDQLSALILGIYEAKLGKI